MRNICSAGFNSAHLNSYIQHFYVNSLRVVHGFRDFAASKESFNPLEQITLYTASTSTANLCNFDIYENGRVSDKDVLAHADNLDDIFVHFQNKLALPALNNKFLYWLLGLRQKELKVMKKALTWIEEIIIICRENLKYESGSNEKQKEQSLIEILMQNTDVSDDEIRTQMGVLIPAAIDTTKTMNHVILMMLAIHPHVQDLVYKELIEVLGQDINHMPSHEDLMRLVYIERVIKEALRIMPSVPIIMRKAPHNMTVTSGGVDYEIPAGTKLTILIKNIHNDPVYYENPKLFDPDRWLPARVAQRHPHCYFPFSSGPRACMGRKYVMMQIKMFMLSVVRQYEILPSEKCRRMEDIETDLAGSLRLKDHCQIRLRLRNN